MLRKVSTLLDDISGGGYVGSSSDASHERQPGGGEGERVVTRYQLAKLVQWAGTLRTRKRLQKTVYLMKRGGAPFEDAFCLHRYGPHMILPTQPTRWWLSDFWSKMGTGTDTAIALRPAP